ncbi:hypothetical protein SAMN05421640_2791 [Ekhidna lutea]|uniref:Uncharacterized protein n=1 Tax=Ekhidna lutea TaxID=447679 RepID=A0A239KPL0_EKHLU|nr:hypothetical protein [Ekhidna lutea]SNT19618.1 hypothetical protein SAMN05421640_2791 [Ekhidna lutea]
MSKKETIEDRVKSLSEKEEKLKLQLSNDSDEVKGKVLRVGKIALIAGGVALLGYWVFNTIFGEEEDEDVKPKKKKKKRKNSDTGTSRLTALFLPYLSKYLETILGDEPGKENKKENDSIEKEEN